MGVDTAKNLADRRRAAGVHVDTHDGDLFATGPENARNGDVAGISCICPPGTREVQRGG